MPDLKVHLESNSGFYPCGASNPQLTSEDPEQVTCHLFGARVEWSADPVNQRRTEEAKEWHRQHGLPW